MQLPALSLQTVWFHEDDKPAAQRLGADLYEKLTRPAADPLAHGPGIPVRVGVEHSHVNLQDAATTMVIPVLGQWSYNEMREVVIAKLRAWHAALGAGRLLVVPDSGNWRAAEVGLPVKQLLTLLYGADDGRRQTIDEIMLATARVWEVEGVRLFISHAKADLEATGAAAKKIHDHVVTDGTGRAFFDATDLHAGESLTGQLTGALDKGVLIAVRGDAYSSRVWCQQELLVAKLNGLPTLTVEVLSEGELRSSPYSGNSPSIVWVKGQDHNPARVATQAMIEWLRAEFFRREADRIKRVANLPEDVRVVTRPPELLDLAQGPLQGEAAQLVLHPDPELSALERRVLKAARPRLHLATPTTAFRRLLGRRDESADASSPLEGMQVAMSLSETPDAGDPEGFTAEHVRDATVNIARTVISAGAAIAYGGIFDLNPNSYTPLLIRLIQTYNQSVLPGAAPDAGAAPLAQDLHSYLAAIVPRSTVPRDFPIRAHHLGRSGTLAHLALLPDPAEPNRPPDALYYSDMRRAMEKCTAARVVLGGQAKPRVEAGGKGYGGRYPGVVEEAWRTLQAGNPLYVAGGFGGAAALVAELLQGKGTPKALQDATWTEHDFFRQTAKTLDAHPLRKKLGLPTKMEDLAKEIVKLANSLLKNDETSLNWNGLTKEENFFFFQTRDPVALAALVSKGLLRIARKQSEGKLQIELVHDSLAAAEKLDAVAIAVLKDVPLGGAGAALDVLTGGSATAAHQQGKKTLVSLKDSRIDADWLFLASLGTMEDSIPVAKRVEQAARETADEALRHGFQRVGIVTFGGSMLPDTREIATAMLSGLRGLANQSVLVWHETDDDRFKSLCEVLGEDPGIKLTTKRALTKISVEPRPPESMILFVTAAEDRLLTSCVPPGSSAVTADTDAQLSNADLARLSQGIGPDKRSTPNLATLEQRGSELAELLFGANAAAILSACKGSRIVVNHNAAASKVPFEMLLGSPDIRPSLDGGITRRLSVTGLAVGRQFAKPPKNGRLRILLVNNPTDDLPGAAKEAAEVAAILGTLSANLDLDQLVGSEATPEAVAAALARADIVHYCGHAFFDGPKPKQSGLVLAGGIEFTGEDLRKLDPLPRMAFVNACEAGRVRGRPATKAAAFAELFLHGGIDAYLGTYWEVGDRAAALFAGTVYRELALGQTLEQATLKGRKALFEAKEQDWANYMLFGGQNFRLVTEVGNQKPSSP